MPQRRRRTYIVGYLKNSPIANRIKKMEDWTLYDGVMAQAFPFEQKSGISAFEIEGSIKEVSDTFNKTGKASPFGNAGIMIDRQVFLSILPLFIQVLIKT